MKEFEFMEEKFADCVDAATGKPIPREGDVVLPERVIYHGKMYIPQFSCESSVMRSIVENWNKLQHG